MKAAEISVVVEVSYRCERCGVTQETELTVGPSARNRSLKSIALAAAKSLEATHRSLEGCKS